MRCNNCIHYDVCYQYDIIGEDDSEMCALYDQKRPHGEWLPIKNRNGTVVALRCSTCGQSPKYAIESDFCSRCGADMQVKNELNRVSKELNSEIEKSKSEIVPDYRDGWRVKEGDEE